jgi:tetratricopeptide (TPR) repeat protein
MTSRWTWTAGLLLLVACNATSSEHNLASPGPKASTPMLTNPESPGNPFPAARILIDQGETPGSIDHAIALLEAELPQKPHSVQILVMLAEANSRCLEALDVKKQADLAPHEQHRTRGRGYAQEALRLEPNLGVAHYWLGCLLLHAAEAERSYGRLKEALPHLRLAEQQVPATDGGGPARMLGRVYQETPGGFLLGSKPEAIKWYQKSLAAAPDSISTNLWLGETYVASSQPVLARPVLERAAAINPRHGHEKEEGAYRQKAEALIKKLPPK